MSYQVPKTKEEKLKFLEDLKEQYRAITSVRDSYRELLPARRDFFLAIILGIVGNAFVSFFFEIKIIFIPLELLNLVNILGFIVTIFILLMIGYEYRSRTSHMIKSLETLSAHIKKNEQTTELIVKLLEIEYGDKPE